MIFYLKNLTKRKASSTFFKKILGQVCKFEPQLNCFEISLVLTSDQKIRNINQKYRGVNQVTDVLSFKLSPSIGEIFIAGERGIRQAKKMGHSPKRELATLFVHGLLHIAEYNDETGKERLGMFEIQDKILADLKTQNII